MVAGNGRIAGSGRTADPTVPRTSCKAAKRKPTKKPNHQIENKNPYAKYPMANLLSLVSSAAAAANSFLRRYDILLLPSQSLYLESLLSSLPIPSLPSPSPCSSYSSWFHRFLCSASADDSDPRWTQCFRMSRPTFSILLSLLSHSLLSTLPSAPPDYALAAALFRLAHGASYKSIARRFGFHSSADASRAFYSVCKLVNDRLGHLDDPRPDFSPHLLPNCCGVLGLGKIEVDGELLGQNGSLLVQALVDSEGRFLDISVGWPSTMKPKTIFHQTKLYSRVEESRDFLNGLSYNLSKRVSIPQYILGDSCFPLLSWLMTPYNISSNEEEDSFETSQREFNNAHSRGMCMVDNAFAGVRSRWQLLGKKWKPDTVEFLPFVITTACLLHNFLINCCENSPVDDNTSNVVWLRKDDQEEEILEFEREVGFGARRIRDAIAENLSRVSSRR